MRVVPVIQVTRALALTALCFCASSLAAGSGNSTTATVALPAGNAHALLGAKSWGGAVDVHVSGPYELKLYGPDGSAHLGSTRLSSTLRVTFHFDKLIQVDEFSATWAGSAHWSVSEHEYHEFGAKGQLLEWGPSEASGDATTKATFSINFPEETGKGPGYWSIDLGDPSIHYRSTTSDIAGRTETWSGKGTTEALNALEETDLGERLPANGYIHGTKVETQESRLAEARARIKKDIPPSMGSLQKSFENLATIEYEHPAGPDSRVVMPKSTVHWTILPDPCTGEDRRIRIAHTAFKKEIVFDIGGASDSELGQAGIDPEQYASMAEDIGWAFPAISGLQVTVGRGMFCNSTNGCTFNVQFQGMPAENSGYGHKKVSLHLPGFESCVKPKYVKVAYFYSRDGRDNPEGKGQSKPPIPNWFHYWSETPAVQHFSPLQIMYDASSEGCFDKKGDVAGYFTALPEDAEYVHLCDDLVQIPWPNPVTGRITVGIDAYATTLLHEFAHKRHYHEWWIAIDREIEHASGKRKASLIAKKAAMDKDHDHIPDRLECRWRKDGTAYCPRWRGRWAPWAGVTDSCKIHDYDEHCLIYRYDQPKWRVGTADKEDWSCPGKQSGKLCHRDAMSGGAASAETNTAASTEDRRVEWVATGSPRGVAETGSGEARSRARRGDPPAALPASSGEAAPTPMSAAHAASLLENADPLAQVRGLNALSRSDRIRSARKLHLMLPAFRNAVAATSAEKNRIATGFLPQQDWLRLQYLKHVAALGPKVLPALRSARLKATGPYREYLTLALAASGGKHPVRLLSPLVKKGSTWVIRRQAVLLVARRAGTRRKVQNLLKGTLKDPAEVRWQSDVGGPQGPIQHLYPVRDAAALMLVKAGYNIKRTAGGGYVAVWTPAVPRLAHAPETAPAAASADDGTGVNRQINP